MFLSQRHAYVLRSEKRKRRSRTAYTHIAITIGRKSTHRTSSILRRLTRPSGGWWKIDGYDGISLVHVTPKDQSIIQAYEKCAIALCMKFLASMRRDNINHHPWIFARSAFETQRRAPLESHTRLAPNAGGACAHISIAASNESNFVWAARCKFIHVAAGKPCLFAPAMPMR